MPNDELHEAARIDFRWLLRLRWWALAAQFVTIAGVEWVLHIDLPSAALTVLVGAGVASNAAGMVWARRAVPLRETAVAGLMGLDVVLLTGVLSLTGGSLNPFTCLYLVHVALAAVVLPAFLTWMLVLLALACFGLLFAVPLTPLDAHSAAAHAEHLRLHLDGMWVAFGVAAGFIVYSVQRVTRALAARETELAAARALTARNARFTSLATLAAGAAHELATPLSTIAVVAKELEHHLHCTGRTAEAVADARLIRQQVTRCRNILLQMTADADREAGEPLVRVSVAHLLETALDDLTERPRITVRMAALTRGLQLEVPRRAVAQVLRSVVKNAQQASPVDAEVQVAATCEAQTLRFTVRDRGHGMAPEVMDRAGEPFFTTKPPGQGMGLGLFLTRAVLARLGGTLELASVPGGGTTAVVTLPIRRAGARCESTVREVAA
jgi:two-component system sensor histidine kinase RegB